jgi:8-oxo-dGTP pyrophosphatase MutT (NUDIX family)
VRVCRYQAAILRDREVLLVRHTVRASGHHYWVPPGGGREDGETEEECVAREVLEETGLVVRVVRLLMDVLRDDAGPGYRQHKTYLCDVVSGEALPGYEPEDHGRYDISDVGWFSIEDRTSWPAEIADDAHTTAFLEAVAAQLK